MKFLNSINISFCIIIFSFNVTQGQTLKSAGFLSDPVTCFAVSGRNIFAGIRGEGVFRSLDNGQSWTAENLGLTNKAVKTLAVFNDTILFTGTIGGGIFRSTDNGKKWTETSSGINSGNVLSIVTTPDNVFAATDRWIYYSNNNGDYWSELKVGLQILPLVSALAVKDGILYAASINGLYRCNENNSSNSGGMPGPITSINGNIITSWTVTNCGLTAKFINSLAIYGSEIFAATNSGIYLSSIGSFNWVTDNNGLTNKFVNPLFKSLETFEHEFSSGKDNHMSITDILKSLKSIKRNGNNNTQTIPEVNNLAIKNKYIFAGTDGGMFLSTDNGTTWNQDGLPEVSVTALAVIDTNLFAGTYGGAIYISRNNGLKWKQIQINLGKQ